MQHMQKANDNTEVSLWPQYNVNQSESSLHAETGLISTASNTTVLARPQMGHEPQYVAVYARFIHPKQFAVHLDFVPLCHMMFEVFFTKNCYYNCLTKQNITFDQIKQLKRKEHALMCAETVMELAEMCTADLCC